MKIRKQKKEAKKKMFLMEKQNQRFKDDLNKQLESSTFTLLKV